MTTIGSVEARAEFHALLKRVAAGEQIIITENGKPVARLVPPAAHRHAEVDDAIAQLKALRRGTTLGGLAWTELRDAGRR